MSNVLLTIVRHRGGGFHLGVIEEQKGTARFLSDIQIIVRAYNGLLEQHCFSSRCLYKYKSIYTDNIHAWLADKRGVAEETIPMFTATLERTETEDIYTITGMAPFKKVSRRRIFIDQEGINHHYSNTEFFNILFHENDNLL